MKVTPGQPKSIVLFRPFINGSTGSMVLHGADGSTVELTSEVRVQRYLAVYSIPGDQITDAKLPMTVDLRVNGESLRSVELVNSRPAENGPQIYEVHYNNGWGPRPTDDASIIVSWFGGTPSTPPTGALAGMDLWFVPNEQEAPTDD